MGNEEFHIKLLNDIKETGYPLELKIANKFRNNSWQLKYNSYYVDKDEKKGREIDLISNTLRAFPEKDTSESEKDKYPYLEVNLSLIIEIKESRDKPWVVFTTEKTLRDSNFPIIGHYPGLDKRKVRKIFKENGSKTHKKIGRSFYVGFTGSGGRDDIFKALTGTRKALEHYKEASNIKNDKSEDKLFYYYEPVIILDGKLFESHLDDQGNIELKETDYLQVAFNYLSHNYKPLCNYSSYITHLITAEYLETFINRKEKQLDKLYSNFKSIFVLD